MTVTYSVALPFVRTEEGVAPGQVQEMSNETDRDPAGRVDVAGPCSSSTARWKMSLAGRWMT